MCRGFNPLCAQSLMFYLIVQNLPILSGSVLVDTFSLFVNVIGYLIFLGALGIFANKYSFLQAVISIELLFYGINILFVLFSLLLNDITGSVIALFVLMFAGGESALALALIVSFFNLFFQIKIPTKPL